MDIEKLKGDATADVDSRHSELTSLSLRIHQNPEQGFNEVNASSWLCEYMESNGFSVERGICQLPTAFRASYGAGGPIVALLAEYDALPGLGHGCGHNIIGTAAAGAAVAARQAADQLGGRIVVIGTPAEEIHGGKAIMAERGAFTDVDVAMIVHPGTADVISIKALACISLDVEFFGKAAHAASTPQEGINALEAMILSFNGINSLRQHITEQARIHGIITRGGEAPNVVPDHTAGVFLVRAPDESQLEELKGKVLNCFQAAALATGASLQCKWTDYYAPIITNQALADAFAANMRTLGRNPQDPADRAFGSSDVGNVSALVPIIHPVIAIAPPDISLHSPEFTAAAAEEGGHRGLIDGAKAMAITAVDVLASPELMIKIREDFLAAR
ncbi:MAG: M20 family metallopeptidase [Chloroflexota bacterium]|nr:M20 family metallopeptidase [Chloroflexota bacterium]